MNCDWTKENIVLYIYDELADDAKHGMEQHIRQCPACDQELRSAMAFKGTMSVLPAHEVPPNLLAASRMKLQEALEEAEQSRGWSRFAFDITGWMHQIKLAPALSLALLITGFFGGTLTTYRIVGSHQAAPAPIKPAAAEANIAAVESIVQDASTNRVSIKYDTLHPQVAEGSANDPLIQRLLLVAARNNRDSGLRLDSIDLLAKAPEDNGVREALIYALRYDKNPGVRLKTLDALKGYVKDDVHVRDAVLESLMHDTNPGVRERAMVLLGPVRADMSVREALQVLAEHDKSKFIRSESQRLLASTPDLD
ncbi:MAG TPA: HEAT repeat domain-containing protein [Candidatus Angelobacter sp.]|nr:HEAT repeat domain-containing protein [Candidatus Angelobacter sp.]